MNPHIIIPVLLFSALGGICVPSHAEQTHPVLITDHAVCAPDGVALGGYDPVAYFLSGPQKGLQDFSAEYENLTYYFSNAENRARFIASPDSYLPKYRGWCSATLSMGRLACPDFTNYKIEDGQLLLFERIGFSNGLDMWNADPETAGRNADSHFHRLLQEAQTHTTDSE